MVSSSRKPVLVGMLGVVALVALYFIVLRDEPATSGKTVRIEVADGACWSAVLPADGDQPDRPLEEQGCASVVLSVIGSGAVAVSKTTEAGTLTVVALVDDEETDRQSTADPFGSILTTPERPE